MRRALVAAFLICMTVTFAAGFLVGAITTSVHRIENQAAIKAVGVAVYQDPALTVPLTEINWGILEPGEEKNHTAYIKNESNVLVTLALATENWSPLNASSFMALTWDYGGQPLGIGEFLEVTFTLAVDPAIYGIETFSFDIVIMGSG